MNKRKVKALIDSDDSDNSNRSHSDADSLPSKRRRSASSSGSDKHAKSPKKQASNSDSETSDSDSDWDAPKKKKRLQTKSSLNKVKRKRSDGGSNSDTEEGEVSDSSKSSNDSSDDSDLEFDDGFDANLIGDEEDRERLERMTEKEREQEIFNRLEKREVLKARFEIEKKLRHAKKQQKRKRDDKDSDRAQEKKSTSHNMTDRKKAIEESKSGRRNKFAELKAKRMLQAEEREKQEAEKKKKKVKDTMHDSDSGSGEGKAKHKLKLSEVFSSGESDGESVKSRKSSKDASSSSSSSSSDSESEAGSGEGSDNEKRMSKPVRSESVVRHREKNRYISTLEELEKIRLSRHKLENFVSLPLFLKAVIGCFVKIGIGQNSGRSVYRVAEIIEVVETSKIYSLGSSKTNKGFKLRHGNDERVFRLEFISNSKFSSSEFNKWVEACTTHSVALPTQDQIIKKEKDIRDMICYHFSNEDIEKMVKEKARFNNFPTNYAVAKTALLKEREIATIKGDEDTITRLNTQMGELEEKANAIFKKRTSTIASISYINERNRKSNVERAEKAILAEVEERKGMRNEDPFTRRSTRPTKMSMGDKKDSDVQMTSALLKEMEVQQQEADKKQKEDDAIRKKTDEEKRKAEEKKRDLSHDPFDAHNFDIKIDIDASHPTSAVPIAPRPTPAATTSSTVTGSAPRRSLKFEEYKRIKGII